MMARGSPIFLQTTAKNCGTISLKMLLNVKLQDVWAPTSLGLKLSVVLFPPIICTKDQAEGQNWMYMIFRPFIALKTETILHWTSLHELRKTSRNHRL